MNQESELVKRFASLRRRDSLRTPSFDAVLGRARRRPTARFLGTVAAAAGVIAFAALAVFEVSGHRAAQWVDRPTPGLTNWHASTDFLLDTPGAALLHSVPAFGPDLSTPWDPLPATPTAAPAPVAGQEHS